MIRFYFQLAVEAAVLVAFAAMILTWAILTTGHTGF